MRTYIIINMADIELVDFNEALQTSEETVRLSTDLTKGVLKWEGSEPAFVSDLPSYDGPYTHAEILPIMDTPTEWNAPVEEDE